MFHALCTDRCEKVNNVKVDRSVYIANSAYQFCRQFKTYYYEKRVKLNQFSY